MLKKYSYIKDKFTKEVVKVRKGRGGGELNELNEFNKSLFNF